ncbi:MAG: signal recognition particle protein [Clostridiales bacterium]|jgi:signal recognition particle subunit SRP54|nr:signal recognition particle protein [Clostridiales bacterium]
MALFAGLSERLNHIFSKMKNKGKLTELEIKQVMREVRIALLEADVNFGVVKDFINRTTEKAVGEEILKSLTPAQQIIKIVNDELVELMGTKGSKLTVNDKPPTIYMMCGLQGAGKTTMCGKLAAMLKKQGKGVLLVACDIYRPAAIKQLQIVGERAQTEVFTMGQIAPIRIAQEAVKHAEAKGLDTIIIDTAGRLHIDEALMGELKDIKRAVRPSEILLVVDSMTGQDAVTVSDSFNKQLDISGVILTKLDGDTRGGAALSIRAVTGKPIKFTGIGEKMGDIEPFYPDRMASRILGMGDVLSLIEKAEQAFSAEETQKLEKRLKEKSFDFNDYLLQLNSLKKMGSMKDILAMLPAGAQMKNFDESFSEKQLVLTKAMILSMTKKERLNPDLIKGSQKKRIANGSGTSIQDVNKLLKQYEMMKNMMKQMSGKGNKKFMKMPFGM